MTEVLSLAEIKRRFPDEWVLIVDLETEPDLTPRCGRVAAHGPVKEAVQEKAIELRPKNSTVCYTGELVSDGIDCVSVWTDEDLIEWSTGTAGETGNP